MASTNVYWKWALLLMTSLHHVFSLPSPETVSAPTEASPTPGKCVGVEGSRCQKFYSAAWVPNIYGDTGQESASARLDNALAGFAQPSDIVLMFFCALYMPPCPDRAQQQQNPGVQTQRAPLPCLPTCEMAEKEWRVEHRDKAWPISCSTLPTEYCTNVAVQRRPPPYNYWKYGLKGITYVYVLWAPGNFLKGATSVAFVKSSIHAKSIRHSADDIPRFAPLEVELGENNDNYELEVVSLSDAKIPLRRYDIADLGDPDYFQGWADVQGTGAANDYCRVVGKGKRRFLSCNLAGSTDQGHHYVSKLGFDAGHPNTWFMRDMDGDGRDDYCRCLILKGSSKTTCTKAGEHGFYGSTTQGGNQNTFSLPGSDGCHRRRFNHVFGE